jgi:ArsR family transcriptional regulator
MLNAARKRTAGLGNVELRQGDLLALPLADASVDAALMILALTYVSDPARALGEMARIVRPGGRAVVLDLLLHDDEEFQRRMGQESLGFEPEQMAALLADAGLSSARTRVLPPESGARGPALLLASATRPVPPQAAGPGARDLMEI